MDSKGNKSDDFFHGKRPWSLLKDQILSHYLPPYFKKVKNLNKRIIVLDGFAGPGIFDDKSEGSPVFICRIADELIPGQYTAMLINKDPEHHKKLTDNLDSYIKRKVAFTFNTTAAEALSSVNNIITDQTVFVYLDQFGVSGFTYNSILPYLKRDKRFSTELLLNINVSAIHRLSAKSRNGDDSVPIKGKQNSLTESLGGDYWQKYLFDDTLDCDKQIFGVMDEYKQLLSKHIEHVGYCPVYESGPGSTLKYFLFFASRHIDAVVLLNDIMFDAYYQHIWKCQYENTLFGFSDKTITLPSDYDLQLKKKVLHHLKEGKISRLDLWKKIIVNDFMKFKACDFTKTIKSLNDDKKISFVDVTGTKRLNNESILKLN